MLFNTVCNLFLEYKRIVVNKHISFLQTTRVLPSRYRRYSTAVQSTPEWYVCICSNVEMLNNLHTLFLNIVLFLYLHRYQYVSIDCTR